MKLFIELCLRQGKQVNLQLKTAIEGSVIKWAHQINDVLMENSEVFFKDNNHPIPSVEVNIKVIF